MRIGVLGLGRIGALHARNASAHADVVLHDPVPGRAEAVRLDAAIAPDVGELWRTCDGVVIATPTATHAALTLEAARAGVPVLCEKPLAMEPGELRKLIGELGAHPVMVGFQRRYDPAYVALRRRIAEVGAIQLIRSTNHDRVPPAPEFLATSGGIWRDLLIHDLDVVSWMAGEPVTEVSATGDDETGAAVLRFASGAMAVVTGTRRNGQGYDCRLEVFGADATLATGLDARTPVVSMERGMTRPESPCDGFMDRFAEAYRAEMAHFIRLIRGRADSLTPPAAGLHALEIALACRDSARRGVSVRVRGDEP